MNVAAITLVAAFAPAAVAQDATFTCQDIGGDAPLEPLGDREGHAISISQFSCRVDSGPMSGGVMTGTGIWEWNGPNAVLVSQHGAIRKPEGTAVFVDTRGTLGLTMADGKVTGWAAELGERRERHADRYLKPPEEGSWSNGDRITEIGAVKVRNHEVVAEWHSLINPQRSIPANITRLTGINHDMVQGAPVFAEVADSFMQFMSDGIFVAHSVNFDYGFISYEYERLERRFRFPKLCTCARMRRRYPGHQSYSLGNLCETYDIDLKEHHRALCDARAAAQLLNLINQKREERAETPGAAA